MKENDNIKKMASILRSGATMLDKYCPKCDNILFRLKNNDIFCPVCEHIVKIVSDSKDSNENNKRVDQNPSNFVNKNTSFFEINNALSCFCGKLIEKLNATEDMIVIEHLLNNIDKIIDIIKKIRSFDQ